MHPNTLLLLSGKRTKEAFSQLSSAELEELDNHFTDISGEEIETDVASDLGSPIRQALSGRYRIYRKLCDDIDGWGELSFQLAHVAGDLEQQPDIIAAALAIRPEYKWEWSVVEAWSWVYRHAALLDIDIDDFAEWCVDQDPQISRAFVEAEEKRQGCVMPDPGAGHASLGGGANDNT